MSLLNNRIIQYQIDKADRMTNITLNKEQVKNAYHELTQIEFLLFVELYFSYNLLPEVSYYSSQNLAQILNVTDVTIRKAKSALHKKGFIIIKKHKNEDNNTSLRVVIGKEHVKLYNLGVRKQITNMYAYKKLANKYDLFNPTLSLQQRKEIIECINKDYDEINKKL